MKHFRLKKTWIIPIVGILFLVGGGAFLVIRRSVPIAPKHISHELKETYSCSMHPSIISDKPGKCPICQMDLQKVEEAEALPESHPNRKDKKILFYRHPMRPDITSTTPSKDEMGMDYVPVYEEDSQADEISVAGRAAFNLSPERQQLIGVTTAKAKITPLNFEIRASGRAAFDPDLFTAVEEYRQAVLSRDQMKNSSYESLRTQARELVSSVQTRLRLLGLSNEQIRKLGQGNASPMNLLLPKGNVWIYAEVFEYELPKIKENQNVEVTSPSLPGRTFMGRVASISPVLNAQTRTARVRFLVPDPEGVLRPDTFVNVKIQVFLGNKLAIPSDAVLHSGDENFVFVVQGDGRFEPRRVELGTKVNDYYEILSGVSSEESVVTSANFLIDSESRLRGVLKNAKSSPSDKGKNSQLQPGGPR